ncbi:MAG TPA: riboflavin synthase [Thermodesulfobacteriota bacterium]|nr:riboflavin synthase [Thermodesulfobacteriota bacterium]
MFTGIIEAVGEVKGVRGNDKGTSLQVSIPESFDDIKIGDSISVNGVCLTAKVINGGSFSADVSSETISKTTFGRIKIGGRVNLERALRLSDRLGGHIVSGHIDGTARLKERRDEGESVRLSFSLEKELLRYVINKGSIAIDGISLTVNEVGDGSFTVNIIPHTAKNTTILDRKAGDEVNIEVDIIGKYVERLLGKGKENKIDSSFLSEHGFL